MMAEEETMTGRRHEKNVDKMARELYDAQQKERQAADDSRRREAMEADGEFVESTRERLRKDEQYAEQESVAAQMSVKQEMDEMTERARRQWKEIDESRKEVDREREALAHGRNEVERGRLDERDSSRERHPGGS